MYHCKNCILEGDIKITLDAEAQAEEFAFQGNTSKIQNRNSKTGNLHSIQATLLIT